MSVRFLALRQRLKSGDCDHQVQPRRHSHWMTNVWVIIVLCWPLEVNVRTHDGVGLVGEETRYKVQ